MSQVVQENVLEHLCKGFLLLSPPPLPSFQLKLIETANQY